MDKLWRILIFPRKVFDELQDQVQTALPLGTLLACLVIGTVLIAFLAPLPIPTEEKRQEYWKAFFLLRDEPNRQYADAVLNKLEFELYGPKDEPQGTRVGSYPWDPVLNPLYFLMYLVFLGTSLSIVRAFMPEGPTTQWKRWFGFACWAQIPSVLGGIADVVYAALSTSRPTFYLHLSDWSNISINTTTVSSWWTIILLFQGLRSWTKRGFFACLGFTLGVLILAVPAFMLVSLGMFYIQIHVLPYT